MDQDWSLTPSLILCKHLRLRQNMTRLEVTAEQNIQQISKIDQQPEPPQTPHSA